jgi:hypothetical protein
MSIIAFEPQAIGTAEAVDIGKQPAIVPAAVFIIVEIMLVAETISVILLKEIDPRNPGAAPIAILLSVALLANLGLICSIAAASAANSVRQSKHGGTRAGSGWIPVVRASEERIDSAPADFAGVDFPAPASAGATSPRRRSPGWLWYPLSLGANLSAGIPASWNWFRWCNGRVQ